MAVVIRLQGLRVTAGSEDIRKFFTGLKIPDGGVHIIGGEKEEAFIIFASDEDARRAMARSGGLIRGSPVFLLLSSKAEMQSVLERSTHNFDMNYQRQHEDEDDDEYIERSENPDMGMRPGSNLGYTPSPQDHMASNNEDGSCLFLKGLPFSVTEKEVCDFFGGLYVDDVVLLKRKNGLKSGTGLVKFATRGDALEGLKRDKEYMGSRYIEISPTTVRDWFRLVGRLPSMLNMNHEFDRGRSPVFTQRNSQERVRSRSPVGQRYAAPADEEFCVHLDNLSYTVDKQQIKQLFPQAMLKDDQILHLYNDDGRRTRSAFVLFKNRRDYCDALTLEEVEFLHRFVCIRPISREKMIALLGSQHMTFRPSGNSERTRERASSHPGDHSDSDVCVFVRNLPFDVRKVEILDFFHGFNIREDQVCVLHDRKGTGIGKALVLFGSEAEAMRALSLNGQRFLGSEVILKSISRSQMQQLITEPLEEPDWLPQDERFPGQGSEPFFHDGDSRYPGERIPPDDHMLMRNVQGQGHGSFGYEPRAVRSGSPNDGGNRFRRGIDSSGRHVDVPTCVQLVNLPLQIQPHEIYDFCYGYSVVPGTVSLQYEPTGRPTGNATLLFESRQEALTAINELSGRPIGPRKIQLMLV
ncbi:RNA binding motif protein 12Bb [Salarias fasciatus]|uniref:RRM domain-containing protein n=1 Tax=Salarias fasciatus TaxID=181472 RepID=A0A672J8S5_SALFA|nr:RNA-binding protein 12B [Salarias fasciatus]